MLAICGEKLFNPKSIASPGDRPRELQTLRWAQSDRAGQP
jgi:hypothetical protein